MTKEFTVKSRKTGKMARVESGVLGVVFVDQALSAIDKLQKGKSVLLGVQDMGMVEVYRER